jgi:hypothetical protein
MGMKVKDLPPAASLTFEGDIRGCVRHVGRRIKNKLVIPRIGAHPLSSAAKIVFSV